MSISVAGIKTGDPYSTTAKKTIRDEEIENAKKDKNDKTKAAKALKQVAISYRNFGDLANADIYFRAAIDQANAVIKKAKEEKDNKTFSEINAVLSEIKAEQGRTYYYLTGKTARAYNNFNEAMTMADAPYKYASLSVPDVNDMRKFMYSSVNVSRRFGTEDTTAANGSVDSDTRNEWIYSANINLNTMAPSFFSAGDLTASIAYRAIDFAGTKNLTAPLITPANVTPLMPAWMKDKSGVEYPMLDLNGAGSFDLKLNYGLPMFQGLFTKINLGYAYNHSSLNATAYRNYQPQNSVLDFTADAERGSVSSSRHTVSASMDLFSLIWNTDKDNRYPFANYFTPQVGTEQGWLSRKYTDVYAFLNNDKTSPDAMRLDSYWVGLRINTLRMFPIGDNDANRLNLNIRYQWDRAATVDPASGIYLDAMTMQQRNLLDKDTNYLQSLQASLGYDLDIMLGTKDIRDVSPDKNPFKFTIPLLIQAGLTDLGKAMLGTDGLPRTKTAGYLAASIGVRFGGLETMYTYSTSTDGLAYSANSSTISFGWRF